MSVSVFPLPHTGFHQHGQIMHLLYAKCHVAPLGYRRRGGGRGVCPELGTIQKLEFMESESRCLSESRWTCGAHILWSAAIPVLVIPLQIWEVVPEATRLPIQTMAQRST